MSIRGIVSTKYFVSDADAAMHFYRDLLGLKELVRAPGWAAQYGAPDGGKIAVLKGAEPTHISFDVANLAPFVDRLRRAGVNILEPVTKAEYGDHAVVTDPSGNIVYLVDQAPLKYAEAR